MKPSSACILAAALTACTASPAGPGGSISPPGGGDNPNLVSPAGAFASSDGVRLGYPVRVAVAADDTEYVSDFYADRVLGLKDGEVVLTLANIPQPLGLAVAGDKLYVGSGGRHTVEVYDLAARKGIAGVGGIERPNSIAVAPDGAIYVVDSKQARVVVLRPDLSTAAVITDQLLYPVAVAVDATRVAVADQGNHRVALFDRGGAFVRSLGSEMSTAKTLDDYRGRFTTISGVALSGDDVFVLDSAHSFVQVLDGQGGPRGILGFAGDCESCVKLALDIAVGADGRVHATDPEHRRVVTLATEMR